MKVKDLVFYLDMDNTMVNFSTRENEQMQLERMFDKGFYLSLRPSVHLEQVLSCLREMGATVKVLSGLIQSPYVKEEKIRWCKRYGFTEEDIILLPMEHRKCDYVNPLGKNVILVDDYIRYVEEWRSSGGTAVLVDRKHQSFATMDKVERFCDILAALSKWEELDEDESKILFSKWVDLFV